MNHLYYPYVAGTDSPIPHLFENISQFVADSDFEITTLASRRDPVIKHSRVNEYYAANPGSLLRKFQYLRLALKKYDLIHTGGQAHYVTSQLAHSRNQDLRHLHTFRVDVNSKKFPTERKRKLLEFVDEVSAVSEHTAQTVKKSYNVDPVVVYNAVDASRFRPGYRCPPILSDFNSDKPIFIFVGNFVDRKRPADVIDVARNVEEAIFIMFGDGPLFESIAKSARKLDNVRLYGRVNKSVLPPIYSNSTGLLFPSIREGCPNVVLEAMASETPVVGYTATSMPELITQGETGYLSKPTDIDGLASSVRSVLASDVNKMGRNARKYIEDNHMFEDIAADYLNIYNNLLK